MSEGIYPEILSLTSASEACVYACMHLDHSYSHTCMGSSSSLCSIDAIFEHYKKALVFPLSHRPGLDFPNVLKAHLRAHWICVHLNCSNISTSKSEPTMFLI